MIVGGGSAGCVLASRLSERPSNRVLLLEAGEDYAPGREPPEILDSLAGTAHSNPRFTWSGLAGVFPPRPGNAPDARLRRRYTQGRVIGGGSSVNGMVANRGLPSDYADWVARGATGWDWDDVLPFFRKLESDRDFDGPLHGKDGPVGLRRIFADRWPGFTRAVIGAVEAEGWQDIKDPNATFTDGFFPIAVSNIDDRRVSAAIAYLTAAVRSRPNLRIMGGATVERLAATILAEG
jgi:5-(hydroxymethyl)furfural/furfural oxidase